MGKNKALRSSPHFHVFSYASCVDLTQLLSQHYIYQVFY